MTSGTKEWASSNVNIAYGCSNNCLYCYAKGMAKRFRPTDAQNWVNMRPNVKAIQKGYSKRKGRIMFPTSYDITSEIESHTIFVLQKLLKAGNEVLITTKPKLSIIVLLCRLFEDYRDQIQFRFTITSYNPSISLQWEPHAPLPENRICALQAARDKGFKTSVSMEPFLESHPRVVDLIIEIQKYVTETIWIGPMNKKFCPSNLWSENLWGDLALKKLDLLLKTDIRIDQSKIRYKDSFRESLKRSESKRLLDILEDRENFS